MGLGVLEDTKLDHVPGTVLLNDHAAHTEDITGALKHGQGRDAEIVLSPQPSEDPNDPSVFYLPPCVPRAEAETLTGTYV